MTHHIDSVTGAQALAGFLDDQIASLIQLEPKLGKTKIPRVQRIHAVFVAIIEDAISVRLLGDALRLNQAYIISRALLERITNYCFLQLCSDEDFKDYIDYSVNKSGRRVDRSVEAYGKVRARIGLKEGTFVLPPEVAAAVAKFTSERGREKTRWTNISLPERAAVVEVKLGNTGLFVSLLTIYADASEALHGTLYGATFHLGIYNLGSVPYDQKSLDRNTYSTLCCLYLMAGGAIHTLLSLLSILGEDHARLLAINSTKRFKDISNKCGLTENM